MNAVLATAWTSDRLRLDGLFEPPPAAPRRTPPVYAVVLLHGVGANFYGSTVFEPLVAELHKCGIAVLRANTRGHDAMSTAQTEQGGRLQGAAYEIVDECRRDVHGWVDWLAARGFSRVGLIGHSLGAIKAVYTQAVEPHELVRRVAALSPPRLAQSAFSAEADNMAYRDAIARARALVDAGQRDSLLSVSFPLPLLLSAATYLDKYGSDRYDVVPLAPRVNVPALFTYGGQELERGGTAFSGLDTAIRESTAGGTTQVEVIPDANHVYSRKREELAQRVLAWLFSDST